MADGPKAVYKVTMGYDRMEDRYYLDRTQAEADAERGNRGLYAECLKVNMVDPSDLSFEDWLTEQERWLLSSEYWYVVELPLSDGMEVDG